MTPEELWKEAIRGSAKAWEDLYRMFGSKLYCFFLKNTGDIEVSMDKTQEVFERLFRHRETFSTGSLKTWMFRIAKNLLIDWWRRRGHAEILSENPPEIVDSSIRLEEDVIDRLEREELMGFIDSALEEMKEGDRLLLGLVYLGGLSFPELAEVMEIPLGTIKTQTRAARLRLDQLLIKYLPAREVKAS
ncbi:MAG: sigma-70 family RNA polymerase sigma factor [Candidatus Riflebacteria bacterium]|nr:sigma-70 family RNA polymerase sigma factor [Candidatus Riflebacteria bacterium]